MTFPIIYVAMMYGFLQRDSFPLVSSDLRDFTHCVCGKAL